MKLKNYFLCFICIVMMQLVTFGQEYAVDKGASLIGGMFSFSSQGGDLFKDEDNNRSNTILFKPSFNYFIAKNVYLGGGIELTNSSQGDYNATAISIGPQIGYAFGKSESKTFPFLNLGFRYQNMSYKFGSSSDSKTNGSDIVIGFGVIVPVKTHIGLTFEAGYHLMSLKEKDSDSSESGNIFVIGVGISGLLF